MPSVLAVLLLNLVALSNCQNTLQTDQKRVALEELKQLAKNDLTHEFITDDYYLARWLRQGKFNATESFLLLREYFKWREEQKLDTVLEEDWSDMRARFPFSRDTVDKIGRPILYIDWGNWDVAGFLEGGEAAHDRLIRYLLMIKEDTAAHIKQLRVGGSNVRRFRCILNAGNWSPAKHQSLLCGKASRDIENIEEKYLAPVAYGRAAVINISRSFRFDYSLFPHPVRNQFKFYGQNGTEWENDLKKEIDLDQFPAGIFNEPEEQDNARGLIFAA